MKLKEMRQRIGTQEKFSQLIGFGDKTMISRWESGKSCPKLKDLPRIAEILGVSVMELLDALEESKR